MLIIKFPIIKPEREVENEIKTIARSGNFAAKQIFICKGKQLFSFFQVLFIFI